MQITNTFNLPDAIHQAVMFDDYDPGECDISITGLIAPPQMEVLRRRHDGDIAEDCSDRLYALMGKAMHAILERAETSALTEQRLFCQIGGLVVSGQYDRMYLTPQLVLQDYKFSSVWEYIFGLKDERIQQLNSYRFLALENGYQVDRLEVVFLFRDWSKSKARLDKSYPPRQIMIVDVPVWPIEKIEAFLLERVALHRAARAGDLPECSPDDRWAKSDAFAVMKKGRKSAVKLHDNAKAAEAHAKNVPGGYVEARPGESARCEHYCVVADFCPQFQAIKAGGMV